jgi:hypothetical protein
MGERERERMRERERERERDREREIEREREREREIEEKGRWNKNVVKCSFLLCPLSHNIAQPPCAQEEDVERTDERGS